MEYESDTVSTHDRETMRTGAGAEAGERNGIEPARPQKGHRGEIYTGLTKREEIAARALQGLLARERLDQQRAHVYLSRHAVKLADHLLEALAE